MTSKANEFWTTFIVLGFIACLAIVGKLAYCLYTLWVIQYALTLDCPLSGNLGLAYLNTTRKGIDIMGNLNIKTDLIVNDRQYLIQTNHDKNFVLKTTTRINGVIFATAWTYPLAVANHCQAIKSIQLD